MRILLTGGSSLLGRYLIKSKPYDMDIIPTWYSNYVSGALQLNLLDLSQMEYIFRKAKPDVVIHCAAIGSVDFAEENYQLAHAVNVMGTENIMKTAVHYGAKVVYLSSNAVYRGDNPPYAEDSALNPINVYGSIKMQAERKVRDYKDWLIIRPFMFYGWPHKGGRNNWATTIDRKMRGEQKMTIVNDVFYQPTYALDCAIAIWKLISFNANNEIVNVASPDRVSLYGFCRMIADIFGHDRNLIQPIKSSDLNLKAKRPTDTKFDLSKLSNYDIEMPSLKTGLINMINEL